MKYFQRHITLGIRESKGEVSDVYSRLRHHIPTYQKNRNLAKNRALAEKKDKSGGDTFPTERKMWTSVSGSSFTWWSINRAGEIEPINGVLVVLEGCKLIIEIFAKQSYFLVDA